MIWGGGVGIAITKTCNPFYPGKHDLAKIEDLYKRSCNLKQVLEGVGVKNR